MPSGYPAALSANLKMEKIVLLNNLFVQFAIASIFPAIGWSAAKEI
nr:MAG TPA: hypothetical protein [Caudoviricetes sp.]